MMPIDRKITDMDLFHPMRLFVRQYMAKLDTKDIKIDNLELLKVYLLFSEVMSDKRATGEYWGTSQQELMKKAMLFSCSKIGGDNAYVKPFLIFIKKLQESKTILKDVSLEELYK